MVSKKIFIAILAIAVVISYFLLSSLIAFPESTGYIGEFIIKNIQWIIGLIITFISYPMVKFLYDRHKKIDTFYTVVWKRSSSLEPKDILVGKGFTEYYYSREEDEVIKRNIENNENVLLIGHPLAGKSRSIYQVLRNLEKPCNVIILDQVDINPKDFTIPWSLCLWRKKILILDDLGKFVEKQGFDYVFNKFLKRNVIILASCSSRQEYYKLSQRLNLSVFGEPIELSTISRKDAEEIAKKLGKDLPSSFDGNIGSIFTEFVVARKLESRLIEKSTIIEVRTDDEFYEMIRSKDFLEQPLKGKEEWESKREIFLNSNKKRVEEALDKLAKHRILLITGPPSVGKSTFMLSFLYECMSKEAKAWKAIIFLNPQVTEEELSSALKEVETSIKSKYGQDSILLAIDGLRRWEEDVTYVNKCRELFRKASEFKFRLIATLNESEKEFLRKKLQPPESDSDQWGKVGSAVIEVSYTTQEMERLLVDYLNLYKKKIELEGISFEEMNRFFLGETIPENKKEQYQKFKFCMRSVIDKSEGLAGYVALLVEDVSGQDRLFSQRVINKYPDGMINLLLSIFFRDYYIENDKVIPVLMTILTKLKNSPFALTKCFFDSFEMWAIERMDENLEKVKKLKVRQAVSSLVAFYLSPVSEREVEYRPQNYWINAIEEAVCKKKYDERFTDFIRNLTSSEKEWKF